jgi:hypothetical protein
LNRIKKIARWWFFFAGIIFSTSCGVYTFSGASISDDVKTVSVQYFENVAPLVNPNLSQLFTESLKDIFLVQTNLSLDRGRGDLNFEGTIVDYSIRPINVQAGNSVAQNRLTITVQVYFSNEVEPEYDYDKRFTRFADFDANQNFTAVEGELVEQILEELTQDVFNAAVVNW